MPSGFLPSSEPRSQPFKKPRGWLMWGLLGMALSPAVVYASAVLSEGLGASDAAGRGTVVSGRGVACALGSGRPACWPCCLPCERQGLSYVCAGC